MKTEALSCTQLVHQYPNGPLALNDLTLNIEEGSFFALLGPNGAGKTTLIDLITGLTHIQHGQIQCYGQPQSPAHMARWLGVVPQELNLNPFQTVEQTLSDHAGFYGLSLRDVGPLIQQLLHDLDLHHKKTHRVRTLSGGMKRRLMIARALVHRPKFLLLDEPTVGVDLMVRQHTWDLLKRLNKEGMTILLTTHYLEEAEALCDQAAFMAKGRILTQGPIETLLSQIANKKLFVRTSTDLQAPWPKGWQLQQRHGNLYRFDVPSDTDPLQSATLLDADVTQCWEEPANLEDVFRAFYQERS